ncbi:MAG: hypothetical protein AAGA83_06935 [Cyanobacteria bacterium P01_F01_bin.116]
MALPSTRRSRDPWPIRVVVAALSLTVIICVFGVVFLEIHGKEVPDLMATLATSSLSLLAGVLVPSPS